MIGLGLGLKIGDGGAGVFSPANLANLAFWVAGDSGFTVSQWTALAGTSVTQATGTNQPTATTLNGRAAVAFNQATPQYMAAASGGPASGNAAHTILATFQYSAVSTANFSGTVGWGNSNTGLGSSTVGTNGNGGSPLWWYGGSNSVINGSSTDTSAHTLIKTFDGSNVTGYKDFVSDGSASSVTMALGSGIAVGQYVGNLVASGSTVIIGEILVYSRVLLAAELTQLHAYLKARWGTP